MGGGLRWAGRVHRRLLEDGGGHVRRRDLLVTGMAFLGRLAGLVYFASRTDRLGSKPVLTFCLCLWNGIMLGWLALAARVVAPGFALVLFLQLLMGFAYALVNMNNTRLAMLLAPVMGRNHFFALYSVVTNVTLGLAPVGWGLVIDAFGERQIRWQNVELNRFSFFFAGVLAAFVLALVLCRKLDEPKARDMDETPSSCSHRSGSGCGCDARGS